MKIKCFEIKDLGHVAVTIREGETFDLNVTTIIHMADEIRSRLGHFPPQPAFSAVGHENITWCCDGPIE